MHLHGRGWRTRQLCGHGLAALWVLTTARCDSSSKEGEYIEPSLALLLPFPVRTGSTPAGAASQRCEWDLDQANWSRCAIRRPHRRLCSRPLRRRSQQQSSNQAQHGFGVLSDRSQAGITISLSAFGKSSAPQTLGFPRGSGLLLAAEAAPLGGWPHHSLWWPCWPLETCR